MATHVRQTVGRQPAVVCDTQKTIAEYVDKLPCMFISAFMSDLSDEEKAEYVLLQDYRKCREEQLCREDR